MKRKQKFVAITMAVFIAAGFYGYKEYSRRNRDLKTIKPELEITATGLIKKFESDEANTNKVFLAKKEFIISVTGNVKEVRKNESGFYSVALGDTASMSSVRCSMDSAHQQEAVSLAKGTNITIKGAFIGYNKDELLGSDIILNRCVIEEKK